MSDLFSTPASHAFSHTELEELSGNAIAGPSRNGDAVARLDIEEAFEVEDTVKRILEGGYKTVCIAMFALISGYIPCTMVISLSSKY